MSLLYPANANDFWTMATAIVGLLALAAAVWYAYTTAQMFRRDHRPMVRVVYSRRQKIVILKNMGRGTAFGVTMTDDQGHLLSSHSVDAVEPLGSGSQESARIGRVVLALREQLHVGRTYHLHYQDITGRWHQTIATLRNKRFVVRFRMVRKFARPRVPEDVRAERLILR